MTERTRYFRPAALPDVEALHASFVAHAYRPHSHPTWTVAVAEGLLNPETDPEHAPEPEPALVPEPELDHELEPEPESDDAAVSRDTGQLAVFS